MNKLEEFISNYNLCTTNTCENNFEYLNRVSNNDYSLNLNDSINLDEVIKIFIESYKGFKDDFNKLPKLDFCSYFDFFRYSESKVFNSRILEVMLYNLKNKINNQNDIRLIFYENENGYQAKFVEGFEFQQKYDGDEVTIKKYLDFGKKYANLIDSYHRLRNNMIYGNGLMVMYTSLYDTKNIGNNTIIVPKLLQEIEKFNIAIGMLTMSDESYIELDFNLDDNGQTVTVKKSIIESERYALDGKDLDYITNNVYINKSYLPNIYNNEKCKTLGKRR